MNEHRSSPILCIGIDIGKRRHVVGFVSQALLMRYGRFDACPTDRLEPTAQSLETLLARIEQHIPLERCAFLLEHTGHYHRTLEQALLGRGLDVYIIAVHARHTYADKNDRADSLRLANLLYSQLVLGVQEIDPTARIRKLHPPSPTAAELSYLVRRRHEIIQDCTRRKNKLTAIVDELFPEFTSVFRNPNLPQALAVREAFPCPAALAAASSDQLCQVSEKVRPAKLRKLQDLAATSLGTTDPHRQAGLILEQRQLIIELKMLEQHREVIDQTITRAVETSREGQILLSFRGCLGPPSAAIILAAIGSIQNFETAAQLKKFCGWAPQSTQTGISLDRMALTKAGARLLKQTVFLAALHAIRLDGEWKQLYERLVPLKCTYDARTGTYKGRMRVVGRICGDFIERIYILLKRDAELLAATPAGEQPKAPQLYDPDHRQGRG